MAPKTRRARTSQAVELATALTWIINGLDPTDAHSLGALAAKLAEEGLPTPAGGSDWTAATVARVKAKLAA